jgi:hypothetical protein
VYAVQTVGNDQANPRIVYPPGVAFLEALGLRLRQQTAERIGRLNEDDGCRTPRTIFIESYPTLLEQTYHFVEQACFLSLNR